MVCGGLPAFHRFHRLSAQILVVVCGGLRVWWLWWFAWFAVVCGGLRWFAMVCGLVCLIVIPDVSDSLTHCHARTHAHTHTHKNTVKIDTV